MIPYLITALTVFSHWVIGKHELAGWGLYLVIDPMWIAYWFTTGQRHFLPMCGFFLVVHVLNFKRAMGRAKALREKPTFDNAISVYRSSFNPDTGSWEQQAWERSEAGGWVRRVEGSAP